jgi:hypothetical protein
VVFFLPRPGERSSFESAVTLPGERFSSGFQAQMEVVLDSSSSKSRAKLFFLGSDWIQSLGGFGLPNKTTNKLLSPTRRVLCVGFLSRRFLVPGIGAASCC